MVTAEWLEGAEQWSVVVTCNPCGKRARLNPDVKALTAKTVARARKLAADDGWTCLDANDFCKACSRH